MPDLAAEDLAAGKLAEYLRGQGHQVTYERPPHDPPDFDFRVDGESWAVEHTHLAKYVQGDDEPLSFESVVGRFAGLARRLERETAGQRRSGWVLWAFGPFPGPLKELHDRALAAICADDEAAFGRALCGCPGERGEAPCDPIPGSQIDAVRCRCPRQVHRRCQCPAGAALEAGFACVSRCTGIRITRAVGIDGVEVVAGVSTDAVVHGGAVSTSDIQAAVTQCVSAALDGKVEDLEKSGRAKFVLLMDKKYLFADLYNVTQAVASLADRANRVHRVYFLDSSGISLVGGRDNPPET